MDIHVKTKQQAPPDLPKSTQARLVYVRVGWNASDYANRFEFECDKCGETFVVPKDALKRSPDKVRAKVKASMNQHNEDHKHAWRRACNRHGLDKACANRKTLETTGEM